MITKEQIEKEANNFSYNKPIERFAFMAGAIWMQKEMDKRRCENCEFLEMCDILDMTTAEPKDFFCGAFMEAKNNDKE